MATYTHNEVAGSSAIWWPTLDASITSVTATQVILTNTDGTLTVLSGSDFVGSAAGLTAGTITSIARANSSNTATYETITGFTLSATAFQAALTSQTDLEGVATLILGGDDTLNGFSGDDTFKGYSGNDTFNGGAGLDTAADIGPFNTGPVDVVLSATSFIDGSRATVNNIGHDTLISVERVIGTNTALDALGNPIGDTFTATTSFNGSFGTFNIFEGRGGNDTINGNGNTQISYSLASAGVSVNISNAVVNQIAAGSAQSIAASDPAGIGVDAITGVNSIVGSNFADILIGNGAVNTLQGLGGDDVLAAGAGGDIVDGGEGTDVVAFFNAAVGVTVNLANPALNTGPATGDSYISIEGIIGGSSGDNLTGDSGANLLTGGLGADLLAGGLGNDVFRFAAGDLVAGESIDGGADTDRLEFGGGAHSLLGATLANIEQIALTGAGATTVTLSNAAQALLFTSSVGSDDTVTFGGDFTPAQIAALAAAGIEHLRVVSNGNAITADYTGGILRRLLVEDTNGNDTYATSDYTYDATGALTSLETLFDSGIDEVISFSAGLKTTVVKTDVSAGNLFTWTTQTYTYDPTGTSLASMRQIDDIGDISEHTYASGALTRFVFTDLSGSSLISSYDVGYNLNGSHSYLSTTYDNGRLAATTFTNGVRSSYLQTDAGNVDPNYHTLALTYSADGTAVTRQTYTADNGNTIATNFVAGTLTGGALNDSMIGAVGADTFVFAPNGGNDYVANFENGADTIDLSGFGFSDFAQVQALAIANGPNGVYLTFGATNHLAVNGLSMASLSAGDFLL